MTAPLPSPSTAATTSSEAELRRIDWRFLLPTAAPQAVVCFGDAPLSEALAAAYGRLLEPSLGLEDACDLAAAVEPDAVTLRAASASLRSRGVCYTEWRRPHVLGLGAIHRRLRAAGLEPVASYWAWPPPRTGRTRFWMPLRVRGPRDYFVRVRALAPGRLARVRRLLMRLALADPVQALLVPLAVIAIPSYPSARATRGPAPATRNDVGIGPALAASLRSLSSDANGANGGRLSSVLLAGGRRSTNKVVKLVFDERDHSRPRFAVKLARVKEAEAGLAREADVLRQLNTRAGGASPGIPRVLLSETLDGLPTLVETALSGTPLSARISATTHRPLAELGVDWLAGLAGGADRRPRAEWWPRLVEPALAEFVAMFGHAVDAGLLRETERRLGVLESLPIVPEQRDFSPWNLLIGDRGELMVLDWESAELRGLPLLDVVYYLAHLAIEVERGWGGREVDVYRRSLDARSPSGDVRNAAIASYVRRVRVGEAAIRPLEAFTWLVHARSEYRRMESDYGSAPPAAVLRSAVFVRFWTEALRR